MVSLVSRSKKRSVTLLIVIGVVGCIVCNSLFVIVWHNPKVSELFSSLVSSTEKTLLSTRCIYSKQILSVFVLQQIYLRDQDSCYNLEKESMNLKVLWVCQTCQNRTSEQTDQWHLFSEQLTAIFMTKCTIRDVVSLYFLTCSWFIEWKKTLAWNDFVVLNFRIPFPTKISGTEVRWVSNICLIVIL